MKYLLHLVISLILFELCSGSAGDHSPYYQRCLERCSLLNCTDDGLDFSNSSYEQPLHLYLTRWSCEDECRYECMWKTVDGFHERKWRTPQFHGKWPFIRILGVQEPASAAFSVLNFYVNIKMLKSFRREVPADSPMYWLWHVYCIVSLNAWFWSTVFHTRDYLLTELLDYSCAFSMVLMSCYFMIIRLLRSKVPRFVLVTITTFFIAFFANHVAYLTMSNINYAYNMQVNLFVGTFTAITWFGWCTWNRFRQPYAWKCALFVALTGMVTLFEIIDRPPFFYVIDYHSLWHLTTAPLIALFYSFGIDDCKYLRKMEIEVGSTKKKA